MHKPLRFSMLGLLAVQLALGLSLRGAATTYASSHTTRGLLKHTVQSRHCHYQVQVVKSPNPGTVGNGLGGIAALSAHDIWAVGTFTNTSSSLGQTTFTQTLIERWNGSRWSVVPSPNPGSFENNLNEIEALSANNIWAVGNFLNIDGPVQTLIEHWNGSRWSVVPSPNPGSSHNLLWGIEAISANDIWTVGNFQNAVDSAPQTLIEHWNGSRWSVIPSPPGAYENSLNGIEALSANDIWAVGSTENALGIQTLIIHWNGSRWSVVPSPNPGSSLNFLNRIEALSANDIWVVGSTENTNGPYQTLIEHWNGSRWNVVPSPNLAINSLYGLSANDIWVVGSTENTNGPVQTLIEHWNGSRWSVVPSPNPGSSHNPLWGIEALSANNIWAVGSFQNLPYGPAHTLIEHITM